MQVASDRQEKMNPDYDFSSEKECGGDLYERLKIMEVSRRDLALKMEECKIAENSDEEEEEEEEEEEFSFAFSGGDEEAAIAAEEAFSNGQIKAVFPLFDQSLLLSGDGESDYLHQNLPMRPPVRRVFVETKEERGGPPPPESSEIAGPYCEWSSRKAVEASPESCKKSNSTGFSKIWRLKEITCRSNSDGRDAFVFLNGGHAPPAPTHAPPPPAPEKAVEKEEAAVKKVVKKGKKKAAAASPHEVYLRSKAKEEERRRSYLPYRPELMGFFTNINGGLSRNVHPY